MKIGVICNSLLSEKQKTGLAYATSEIIKNLSVIDKTNQYILYTKKPLEENFSDNFQIKVLKWFLPYYWTQVRLPFAIIRDNPDVIFSPSFAISWAKSNRTVVMIHDLFALDYPEQYPKYLVVGMRNWLDKAVKKAKKIITISNFTRSEVISKLGADENKVVMVTLGYNSDLYNLNTEPNEDNILNNMGVSGPFFVHIGGNLIERKNTDRIIQAFAKMSTQHKDLKLVIVGSSKSRGDEKETRLDQLKKLVNDLRINDKIIFPGFVTYEQLATLLRRTSCCVYPSLAEGFGLPVIEAMACGAPVITSNTSSLPEAAGNAAIMINPLDEDEIAAAMGKVLDSKTSEKLRRDGLEWVKNFSWHKTASKIKDVLEEAGK